MGSGAETTWLRETTVPRLMIPGSFKSRQFFQLSNREGSTCCQGVCVQSLRGYSTRYRLHRQLSFNYAGIFEMYLTHGQRVLFQDWRCQHFRCATGRATTHTVPRKSGSSSQLSCPGSQIHWRQDGHKKLRQMQPASRAPASRPGSHAHALPARERLLPDQQPRSCCRWRKKRWARTHRPPVGLTGNNDTSSNPSSGQAQQRSEREQSPFPLAPELLLSLTCQPPDSAKCRRIPITRVVQGYRCTVPLWPSPPKRGVPYKLKTFRSNFTRQANFPSSVCLRQTPRLRTKGDTQAEGLAQPAALRWPCHRLHAPALGSEGPAEAIIGERQDFVAVKIQIFQKKESLKPCDSFTVTQIERKQRAGVRREEDEEWGTRAPGRKVQGPEAPGGSTYLTRWW